MRVLNFSSGPAMLPEAVLEQARDEILSFRGTGLSVMEVSHRSSLFGEILASATQNIRDLLDLPDDFHVLFLQGGASQQFAMVPINFAHVERPPAYITTGTWSSKALSAAKAEGATSEIFSSAPDFRSVPEQADLEFESSASYLHYVANETIHGVEFPYDIDGAGVPVVCDQSSNFLSKPIDVDKFSLIYAGAQKNVGPAGVTIVLIRDKMLSRSRNVSQGIFEYRNFVKNASMPNTPNTWGIYIVDLVCRWIKSIGGLAVMKERNELKAAILYDAIDNSGGFYTGNVDLAARSKMNVTFRLPSAELETEFCSLAESEGFVGLKGHRSVGGIRASIYNAFPLEGAEKFAEFMRDFSRLKS